MLNGVGCITVFVVCVSTSLFKASQKDVADLEGMVRALAFTSDGKCLISGGIGCRINVWRLDKKNEKPTLERAIDTGLVGFIESLAITSDGKNAISGDHSGYVKVWDLSNGKAKQAYRIHEYYVVRTVAISPNSQSIASAYDKIPADGIRMFPIGGGKKLRTYPWEPGPIWGLRFLDDNSLIAGDEAGNLSIWDLKKQELSDTFVAHKGGIRCLELSKDASTLAVGGADGSASVWALAPRKKKAVFKHGAGIWALDVSSDKRFLATGGRDKIAKVWDLKSGKLKWELAHPGVVASIAFSSDARWLAAGTSGDTIILWDVSTGKERWRLKQEKWDPNR